MARAVASLRIRPQQHLDRPGDIRHALTFTGFVFSILLLAVQFGSSQFSPRLLRRFLRDPTTKLALGLFIATFLYSLAVLHVVGTASPSGCWPTFPRRPFLPA